MIIVAWRETYPPPEEYGIEIGTEFDSDFEIDNLDSNTQDNQQNELEDNDPEDNNLEDTQPENNAEIENLDDIEHVKIASKQLVNLVMQRQAIIRALVKRLAIDEENVRIQRFEG